MDLSSDDHQTAYESYSTMRWFRRVVVFLPKRNHSKSELCARRIRKDGPIGCYFLVLTPPLFFLLILALPASAAVPDHRPQWNGPSSLTYNLTDLDNFPVGKSGYCKWGNWMDANNVGQVNLKFTWLTRPPFANVANQDDLDLFLSETGPTLQRVLIPNDAQWSAPGDAASRTTGSLAFTATGNNNLRLFRYHHFSNTLTNTLDGADIGAATTKAVILIHGWNPDSLQNNFVSGFDRMIQHLTPQLKGPIGNSSNTIGKPMRILAPRRWMQPSTALKPPKSVICTASISANYFTTFVRTWPRSISLPTAQVPGLRAPRPAT